ncbi:hypothetical protein BH23VER1_BH23VER1_00290 [soil metagenome]
MSRVALAILVILVTTVALRAPAQEIPEPPLPEPEWVPRPAPAGTPLLPPPPPGGLPSSYPAEITPEIVPPQRTAPTLFSAPLQEDDLLSRLPELPDFDELMKRFPTTDLPPLPEFSEADTGARLRWEKNPRVARQKAMAEGKFLLLAFVGMEWNPISRKLNEEVFGSPAFSAFAKDDLVLCYLNFPRSFPSDQENVQAAYESFKNYCGVKGMPSVALFDPDGERFETIRGYRTGRPKTYYLDIEARIDRHRLKLEFEGNRREQLASDGFRTWRNTTGRTIFAKLVGVQDGRIFFENEDGLRTAAPLEVLHFVDREIARRSSP